MYEDMIYYVIKMSTYSDDDLKKFKYSFLIYEFNNRKNYKK